MCGSRQGSYCSLAANKNKLQKIQVDRMCSAEAAIKIKQNKQKRRGGYLFNERVILHCLILAQRQQLVNNRSKAAP